MDYSMLIVDMQKASFDRPGPMYDGAAFVQRVRSLARRVRNRSKRKHLHVIETKASAAQCIVSIDGSKRGKTSE